MECTDGKLNRAYMNIESFSVSIGTNWSLAPMAIRDYIFSIISIGLIRTNEMKKDIEKIYSLDKEKYYNAVLKSSCISHVIITQGTLEQEIEARKVLGILLIAEEDYILRNRLIKLMRKYHPIVHKAVKNLQTKDLNLKYSKKKLETREIEEAVDKAVYFYFSIYCSPEAVNLDYILFIVKEINTFEKASPMTVNMNKELLSNRPEIERIKALVQKDYGNISDYKEVLYSDSYEISDLGGVIENIFIINKLDINQFFYNCKNFKLDKVILAFIKRGIKNFKTATIFQSIISVAFIQQLIEENRRIRELYFRDNDVGLSYQINSMESKLQNVEAENRELKEKIAFLEQKLSGIEEKHNMDINKLNKEHKTEVIELKNEIEEILNQLVEEKKFKLELSNLREYVFQVKNEYSPASSNKSLKQYIENKKILIIGGPKDWRRKFREKYPDIKTLNGFNMNFEMSILNNMDYIFFYTGFMNHSTYYRAMNFIRTHQTTFGYIGKTNIELVEEELIEELKKYKIGRRLNFKE